VALRDAKHGWIAFAAGLALLVPAQASAASPVIVFPSPGNRFATPQTQISFRGVAPAALGTVTVSGSRSGPHPGHVKPDSDQQGASFYPNHPFDAGEQVTVRTTLPVLGGRDGVFRFSVDDPAKAIPQADRTAVTRQPDDVQTFHSRPDLRPASVHIATPSPAASDIFLASMHGPLQWGPMILDPHGSLVWFKPIAGPKAVAANVEVQQYLGHPVLTWWQGFQNYGGGPNEDVIVNQRYQTIATVRGGNGLAADIHEFSITPQGTALITAYSLVRSNSSSTRRSTHNQPIADCFVQAIDIPTGNVLFQWDSLDHVPLDDAYEPPNPLAPFNDYFHINSVQQDTDGNLVISARNTWAVYKIDHRTGKTIWELGGKHSSFKMGPGTRTAYQHDATVHPGGLVTILDNGDWPQVHSQSRVVVERIDTNRHTATLVRELDHSPSLLTPWEGSAQLLSNGDVFVGWGGLPYFTEFDRRGSQILDGRFVDATSSYRAFEHSWSARPATLPAVAATRHAADLTTVYASWNGATDVARWRALAGRTAHRLAPVGVAVRSGFETSISAHTDGPYFAVQAIGSAGQVLAVSRTIRISG
jgi:hypothetical protein